MKRWTGFVLILFAYGIALLHTAIPHHHDVDSRAGTVISGVQCHFSHSMGGGLLQMVFSTDLGYGHLEVFKKSADTELDFTAVQCNITGELPPALSFSRPAKDISRCCAGFIEKLQQRLFLFGASHFRAPPVMA